MLRCICVLSLLAGRAAGTASRTYSDFYMKVTLDLTEGLSSYLTGEDTEAQSCQ